MKPTILGIEAQGFLIRFLHLKASKGGTKVGRMKDPLYKDSYLGIAPPTFILPVEAPDYTNVEPLEPQPTSSSFTASMVTSAGCLAVSGFT